MCSCSGSCNCNSTIIPRGPQGTPGQNGTNGTQGIQGERGAPGLNGVNNFSTLRDSFIQPSFVDDPNEAFTIHLENAIWVAKYSVIYIGYSTAAPVAGGYYMVIDKYMNGDSQALSVYRLSWVLPGVLFALPGNSVIGGSSVSTAGTIGTPGVDGDNGTNGRNAYTSVLFSFTQPAVNANTPSFLVGDYRWMGIGQIVYISSTGLVGGFYQVVSLNDSVPGMYQSVIFKRLDWTIPNISFIGEGGTVPGGSPEFGGSTVSPAGPEGAASELSYIKDAFWGYQIGTASGGLGDVKQSIVVPAGTLTTDDDVLECQTVLRILEGITAVPIAPTYYIAVSPTNDFNISSIALELSYYASISTGFTRYITFNYKIQRTGVNRFRSKGEIFVSSSVVAAVLPTAQIATSFVCDSNSNIVLSSSSNWLDDNQYIQIVADDNSPEARIACIHHEVKVVKKYV